MGSLKSRSIQTKTEEQLLLSKLAEGDRGAFWEIWNMHRDYLYGRCRVWMGGNYSDAEEAISLAALKAWNKLPDHASKITNLKSWLNRLTHNLCIDLHRQQKRKALGVDNIEEKQYSIQAMENVRVNDPEDALLKKECKIYLRYFIEMLPSRLQHPLILRYYQEMSCAEIGETLFITQNNVSKRLQEARAVLRDLLYQYFSGLSPTTINEVQCQRLEKNTFQTSIQINSKVEELSYRVTISCLETLSPVWCSSP